ncbi:helix-turn-helix transcriptional regulator [Acinetobacter baumannii]
MIKNNIIVLRDKAGMTAYQLAKQCGFISNNHVLGKKISDAEKGKNITIETAFLIYTELKKAGVCEKFEDVFWLECDDKDIEN